MVCRGEIRGGVGSGGEVGGREMRDGVGGVEDDRAKLGLRTRDHKMASNKRP